MTAQGREKHENEDSAFNHWDQGNAVSHTHDQGLVLAPGQTTRVDIDMPTSVTAAMEEQPGWLKLAGKAIDAAAGKSGANFFEVRALVHTQGVKNPSSAVKTIGGGLQFSSRIGR